MNVQISYQAPGGPAHRVTAVVHDPREKIQARWLNGRFYETQRHGMLNTVYRRFRGGTFIDIGAAYGNHSLFFAACCGAARVYAFEPVPALFSHLCENIAASGFTTIHARQLALGARSGEVGLIPSGAAPERGGKLMTRIDERGSGVPLARLDDLLRDEGLTEIRCIKIDVEGYSLPVLIGAREIIQRFRPAIFCECETEAHLREVDDLLSTLGYRIWQVDGRPFVMNHTPTYLWEFDQPYDLALVITTYNRPESLRRLLDDLAADAGDRRVLCRVYNDHSERSYAQMPAGSATFTIEHSTLAEHHGKPRYWRLIDRIFQDLRSVRAAYYMQLPDDVQARPGFFTHAIDTYQAIGDPQKICLNLYLDSSRIGAACWTKTLPRIERFGATHVFHTGWVDMCYLAERRFFEALDYTIHPIPPDRWRCNPRRSSGVGAQITRRLQGRGLYQVRECLLQSEDIPSLMNPDRPAHEDLSTAVLDPISCGVASVPARSAQLRQVVEAVLPYVDALHVYLNGYRALPAFLNRPKVTVYRSQEHGDQGDAGKFFAAGRQRGFFLSIDDDISYPEGYVWRLVNALREYRRLGRQVAVGFHGKLMQADVPHFYQGHARLFHFAAGLEQARAVHLLGTGTVAFHSDDLPLTIADFAGPPNMADIHFGIACQRHNVACIVLPRPAGYLQPLPLSHQETIWSRYRRDDAAPSALYNSWREWRLRG